MATHGIFIENANGDTVISDGETSFLYWGKVNSVGALPVNPKAPFITTLFNLPTFVNVKIFVYSNLTRQRVELRKGVSNIWEIAHFAFPSRDITAYVFVEAKHVPTPAYGMAIYNDAGELQFHTARPAIRLVDLVSHSRPWTAGNTVVGYKPATIPFQFEVHTTVGLPPFDNTYDFAAAGKIDSLNPTQFQVGGDFWLLLNTGAPQRFNAGNNFLLATIDAGYYDPIANLPNF